MRLNQIRPSNEQFSRLYTVGNDTYVHRRLHGKPPLHGYKDCAQDHLREVPQMSASRMVTALIGAFGGGAVGRMLGGRTGGMVGSMAGSLLGRKGGGIGSMLGGLMGGGDTSQAVAAAAHLDDSEAMILIKAMCNAAKADGRVDRVEIDAIISQAGDLDPEDEALLRAELDAPLDMASFVAEVPKHMAADVYAASLLPIKIDTASEVSYLQQLGRALGLEREETVAIHKELGLR